MITLSDDQQDALIEICNIGMSKAAKQLSTLLGSSIDISIPKVVLSTIDSISEGVQFEPGRELAYVYQDLSDTVDGRALLIFRRDQTKMLTQSIIGNVPNLSEEEIRACEHEAMIEIGNIIVSACISAISNMLSTPIRLNVPDYKEDSIEKLIAEHASAVNNHSSNKSGAIVIATHLETKNEHISASLVFILTEESILKVIELLQAMIGDI